jgi:hypothetical protein
MAGIHTGRCRLCLETRALCDSHLFAAGFYTILREGEQGEPPVVITQGAAFQSDQQARGHVLCAGCEQRFNREGEDWLIEHAWRGPDRFPLRRLLESQPRLIDRPGFQCYDAGTAIDTGKIAYFALSLLWRAGEPGWRLGRVKVPPLILGPYSETLRRFLVGETPLFPREVVIVTSVSSSDAERYNRLMLPPGPPTKTRDYHQHQFAVPGVAFFVLVGRLIPDQMRDVCTTRGRLFAARARDDRMLAHALRLVLKAPRRGKFAQFR